MDTKEALQRLRILLLVTEDPEDKVAILMAIQALKHPKKEELKKWMRMKPEDWGTPDEKWWPEGEIAALIDSWRVK